MPESQLIQPDARLIEDVLSAGAHDMKKCYQCASCVSVCSLSDGFPRKQVLLSQWGMKQELLADSGPWQCFYCGECSKVCPRQANPGEVMMALRRYLTGQYDWTGLARRMYGSAFWEIGMLLAVALVVVLLFTVPQNFGFGLLNQAGPQAHATVMLDHFAPKWVVHIADWVLALLLGFFLLTNAARMFSNLTRRHNIPAAAYFRRLPYLAVQGITQARWRECKDAEASSHWRRHLLLVTGYATMFILVVPLLPWFQIEDSSFHWNSLLGYYATLALLLTTSAIILDRIRKSSEMHRFSHLSDWLFPILLFLTALSGIVVNILRLMDLAMATYVTYMIHLAIVAPMLVVEVPFGKWAHLVYRPVAIWVAAVQKEAMNS